MKRAKRLVAVLLFGFAGNAAGECTVSVTPINFGVYYPTAASTSRADVAISCTLAVNYNIKLDAGYSGTYNTREMSSTSGPSTLSYNLYTVPDYTKIWGDGNEGSVIVSDFNTGTTSYYPIYGEIPAGKNVPDGVYADAVTVLVEW